MGKFFKKISLFFLKLLLFVVNADATTFLEDIFAIQDSKTAAASSTSRFAVTEKPILTSSGTTFSKENSRTLRITIVTDTYKPTINGVVTTIDQTTKELENLGHHVTIIKPQDFYSFSCPFNPADRVALTWPSTIGKMIKESRPDALHIAVEGPLGWLARYYANSHNIKFTTSYHTCVPEYLKIYFGIPLSWGYSLLRYFHAPAIRTMVTTQSMKERLASKGFKHISIWSRGVDLKTFNPHPSTLPPLNLPLKTHPIFLYVGRITPEKNIEAFLDLNLPGIKCVVGDGPYLALLKNKYRATNIYWAGKIQSRFELAHFYATADVFVFPSKTDTFGNVLLEAMACSLILLRMLQLVR